jgi:hypothetical protein
MIRAVIEPRFSMFPPLNAHVSPGDAWSRRYVENFPAPHAQTDSFTLGGRRAMAASASGMKEGIMIEVDSSARPLNARERAVARKRAASDPRIAAAGTAAASALADEMTSTLAGEYLLDPESGLMLTGQSQQQRQRDWADGGVLYRTIEQSTRSLSGSSKIR